LLSFTLTIKKYQFGGTKALFFSRGTAPVKNHALL